MTKSTVDNETHSPWSLLGLVPNATGPRGAFNFNDSIIISCSETV